MNPVFYQDSFWKLFWNLEDTEIEEAQIAKQAELLGEDFTVEKEFDEDWISWTIKFVFAAGEKYSLLLEYHLENDGCSDKSLDLVDNSTNETFELGWWDLARWHPFCLKPEEFDLLINYSRNFDPKWKDSELPFLLLIDFVGFDSKEIANKYFSEINKRCVDLGISNGLLQTENWLEAIEREKYHWEFVDGIGWTFGNGEYDCYSLRNKTHFDTETEGKFPFRQYNQMIQENSNHKAK